MSRARRSIAAVQSLLLAEPDVRWAYVFGSATRGDAFRDLDVAIMPSATMPQGAVALGLLVARLEEAAGTKVDLVDLQVRDLPLLGAILAEHVLIVDREPRARRQWEAETSSLWLDFKPAYQEFLRVRELASRLRREESGGRA